MNYIKVSVVPCMSCPHATQLSIITLLSCMSCDDLTLLCRAMYVVPWFDPFVIYYSRAMIWPICHLLLSFHVCRAMIQSIYVLACMSCRESTIWFKFFFTTMSRHVCRSFNHKTYMARHTSLDMVKNSWKTWHDLQHDILHYMARHTLLHGTTWGMSCHVSMYVV